MMEMPEGWKSMMKGFEDPDDPEGYIDTSSQNILLILDLMKEMAEALERARSNPMECGHIDHDAYDYIESTLKKFSEWK